MPESQLYTVVVLACWYTSEAHVNGFQPSSAVYRWIRVPLINKIPDNWGSHYSGNLADPSKAKGHFMPAFCPQGSGWGPS